MQSVRAQEKNKPTALLVFAPVLSVASTGTYPDMRQWMCLVDEPKFGAIWWNYFLPAPLFDELPLGRYNGRLNAVIYARLIENIDDMIIFYGKFDAILSTNLKLQDLQTRVQPLILLSCRECPAFSVPCGCLQPQGTGSSFLEAVYRQCH